jgi:predicted DsbA family dithiol-disulfide isomerase
MAKQLAVDVWSDIACPWCYIGKRRLEQALAAFAHREAVDVHWHAFELDPGAPVQRDTSRSYAERLAEKYGSAVSQAQERIDQMVEIAAADGLPFDFERIRPGNTLHAHRLLHLARERGVQDALKERLLRGYLCEGVPIGDAAALRPLALEAGLDAGEVDALLAGDAYTREVRLDERQAQQLGITGVPFFVIGRRYAVSGAQPAELMLGALERAWSELPEPLEQLGDDSPACGPDGCAS